MHRKTAKTIIAILALTVTLALITACSGQDSRELREISDALQQETANMQLMLSNLQIENQVLSARLSEAEALLVRLLIADPALMDPTLDTTAEAEPTPDVYVPAEPEPQADPTEPTPYDDFATDYNETDAPHEPTEDIPATAAINIMDMPIIATSPAAYNSWIPFGEIRTWDATRRDAAGYARLSGGILAGRVDTTDVEGVLDSVIHSGHRHSVTYLLDSQFTRFTGTITLYWGNIDASRDYQIVFVGDEERIFESSIISGGTLPFEFDVDVTGINELRIGRLSPDGGAAIIGIVDAYFIP